MNVPYAKELVIAELAVQQAALLTKKVLNEIQQGGSTISKSDASPVTIADFAAQALLISSVHHNFPDDTFVGEESADALRKDAQIQKKVWDLVNREYLEDPAAEALLSSPSSAEEMMDIIDLGSGPGGRQGRIWILDPIDGTSAFMKGEQYAVSLAFVEDGIERVGVLGCPNMRLEDGRVREEIVDKEGFGLMLSAVEGQGAFMRKISSNKLESARRIDRINSVEPTALQWVEGTTSSGNDVEKHKQIAKKLGISWPGTDLYSSQMRYVALAAGGGNVMVAIPRKRDYKSWVWDHAAGHLILGEAGGIMTDLNGKKIDFGAGRYLKENYGRIVVPPSLANKFLNTVKEVMPEDDSDGA